MRRAAWLVAAAACVGACEAGFLQNPLGSVGRLGSDNTEFSPTTTVFAVVDEYPNEASPDAGVVWQKRSDPRIILFMSRAAFDPEVDLAALPDDERLDLVREVRNQHSLIIEDLAKSLVVRNATVKASKPPLTGEFTFSARRPTVVSTANGSFKEAPPLGVVQAVSVRFGQLDFEGSVPNQFFRPVINIDDLTIGFAHAEPTDGGVADAGSDQGADAGVDAGRVYIEVPGQLVGSTGEVTFSFTIPILPERLGESNLAVLREALVD